MSRACADLYIASGVLCLCSAVFWLCICTYLYHYMFRNLVTRDYRHHFHYLILSWLLLKTLHYGLEGAEFLFTDFPLSISVQVIHSVVHAADFGCLNPVARGWRTTYIHMHRNEWIYTSVMIVGFFILFLVTNLTHWSFLNNWFEALCELFVFTLLIYSASETVKIGESVVFGKFDAASITLRQRLKLLRKILTLLFVNFMKMVYVILVNMDINTSFHQCHSLPFTVIYIVFDLILNPFLVLVCTPRKSDMDLQDIVEPGDPLKVKMEDSEQEARASFMTGSSG